MGTVCELRETEEYTSFRSSVPLRKVRIGIVNNNNILYWYKDMHAYQTKGLHILLIT